jgi:hypothetical protein
VRATLDGEVSAVTSVPVTLHATLDGVPCCASPDGDEVWLARARTALRTDVPFVSITNTKPRLVLETEAGRYETATLRHRLIHDDDVAVVLRTAASHHGLRFDGIKDQCSGLAVFATDGTFDPCTAVTNGASTAVRVRGLDRRAAQTCRVEGRCARVMWGFKSLKRDADGVQFIADVHSVEGPLVCPEPPDLKPTLCHAWAVNGRGEGACFAEDGTIIRRVGAGGLEDGLRLVFGRSDLADKRSFTAKNPASRFGIRDRPPGKGE